MSIVMLLLLCFVPLVVTSSSHDVLSARNTLRGGIHQKRFIEDNAFQFEEHEIEIEPFQLYVQYDNSDAMTDDDEMTVLETTKKYVWDRMDQAQTSFVRLALFQSVRDYPESEHFAKIALGGVAFFSQRSISSDDVQTQIMLGFVGDAKNEYVAALQNAGLAHVMDVKLMSVDGNEMEYQDGQMVQMGNSSDIGDPDSIGSDREMSDDMRKMTVFLSFLIPGLVILLAVVVFSWRFIREINWTQSAKTSPESPVWQSSAHLQVSETLKKSNKHKSKKDDDDTLVEWVSDHVDTPDKARSKKSKSSKRKKDEKVDDTLVEWGH